MYSIFYLPVTPEPLDSKEIKDWLISQVAERLHLVPGTIDIHEPFASYGLTSLDAITLSADLEAFLGRQLSPTLVYEYPSIELLSGYLAVHTENKTAKVQRQRYWVDTKSSDPKEVLYRAQDDSKKYHPLLGERIKLADTPSSIVWQTHLDTRVLQFLDDHQVGNAIIFPAAAYIEMALQAAEETNCKHSHELTNFVFKKKMLLEPGKPRPVQTLLTPDKEGGLLFAVYSRTGQEDNWILNASVQFIPQETTDGLAAPVATPPEVLHQRSVVQFTTEKFYKTLQERGLQYGPGFQAVEQAWGYNDNESLGRIRLPASLQFDNNDYQIHPALLDACLQVLVAIQDSSAKHALYIPTGCKYIRSFLRPGLVIWSHILLQPVTGTGTNTIHADIRLFNENNEIVAELIGFQVRRISKSTRQVVSSKIIDCTR